MFGSFSWFQSSTIESQCKWIALVSQRLKDLSKSLRLFASKEHFREILQKHIIIPMSNKACFMNYLLFTIFWSLCTEKCNPINHITVYRVLCTMHIYFKPKAIVWFGRVIDTNNQNWKNYFRVEWWHTPLISAFRRPRCKGIAASLRPT